MGSYDLRRRARQHRFEAGQLLSLAHAVEAENHGITHVLDRVWPRFEPTTWQGPAADRGRERLHDLRRSARRAMDRAMQHALDLRRRARDLERRAAQLEAQAAAIEAAEAAAARAAPCQFIEGSGGILRC